MPDVFFGVAPHDHTKCTGNVPDFDVPACLPAEEGRHVCCTHTGCSSWPLS